MAPKYMRVAENLRRKIRQGQLKGGDALPTEQDLAAEHEVSRMTVRRGVEELIEEGLLLRQQGRGTFVCEQQSRYTLLYVGRVRGHFYRDRYVEIMRESQKRGHRLMAFSPDGDALQPDARAHLEDLIEEASAIICEMARWGDIRPMVPEETGVVLLTGWEGHGVENIPAQDRLYVVGADGGRAATLATRHLIDLGHSQIAYLGTCGGREETPYPSVPPDRPEYQAYLAALRARGLDSAGAVGFAWEEVGAGGDWQQVAEQQIRAFIRDRGGWPPAFVCEGDFRASPLLRVAIEDGLRLPRQLSVVGMGNTPWAQMLSPPLTSVSMGEAKMARLAVSLGEEEPPAETTILRIQPRLVERASTAATNGTVPVRTNALADQTVSL